MHEISKSTNTEVIIECAYTKKTNIGILRSCISSWGIIGLVVIVGIFEVDSPIYSGSGANNHNTSRRH